jgi:hypothetical protein
MFVALFFINNGLHYISERVVIVIFIVLLIIFIRSVSGIIKTEYGVKIGFILDNVHDYVDSVLTFLYAEGVAYRIISIVWMDLFLLGRLVVNRLLRACCANTVTGGFRLSLSNSSRFF